MSITQLAKCYYKFIMREMQSIKNHCSKVLGEDSGLKQSIQFNRIFYTNKRDTKRPRKHNSRIKEQSIIQNSSFNEHEEERGCRGQRNGDTVMQITQWGSSMSWQL